MAFPEGYRFEIRVEPVYLQQESAPDEQRYVFGYTVVIENRGTRTAQLVRRTWLITDADGEQEEVRGEGVVGRQPVIRPGEHFRYSSGALLKTPIGSMRGSYHLVGEDGEQFDAPIPVFTLAMPGALH